MTLMKRTVLRPYTSPAIKNPTYPTIINGRIAELPWRKEMQRDMTVKIAELKSLKEVQEANCDNPYMTGLYNGLELAMCILEEREPQFKDVPKEPEVEAPTNYS